MRKRKANAKARSLAAKKAWATRRKRAAAEFRRRSKASKKGWRRRKAKEAIEREAKQKPVAKGRLREWQVVWAYGDKREVTFDVIARGENDAKLFVIKAVAKGQDSEGADLTFMRKIPWDQTWAVPESERTDEREPLNQSEINAHGEGWTAKR